MDLPARRIDFVFFCLAVGLICAGCEGAGIASTANSPVPVSAKPAPPPAAPALDSAAIVYPVMLGIDVLEAGGFAAVRGKRIGLLTHPAGVNRRGEHTIDVLRRAPEVQLVALFAPEHGLYGTEKANVKFTDATDSRTGLPVYSLYGEHRKPSAAQLAGLDALVIDLQDIGVRSYTFNVVMRYAMDSCFAHGVEVIVLDRPNPLGGLKVDGPMLDREWRSGVGAFDMPYVHGLTMGELARFAAGEPGSLDVSESQREKGRLTVVPMRGWRRALRWPETGLTFVPTSQYVRDFDAVVGYAMIGLGCEYSGFTHGIGTSHSFRLLSFPKRSPRDIERDLRALAMPGLNYRQVAVADANGRTVRGVFVEVTDWAAWNPTELSFHLMRLACRCNPPNPFALLRPAQSELFNKHVGSTVWWNALRENGAQVSVETWLETWSGQAKAFRQRTRKYWLYPN